MTQPQPSPSFPSIPPEDVARHWGWLVALGVLLMLAGLAAMSFAVFSTLATVFTVGLLLVVAGVLQGVMAIRAPGWGGFFLNLLGALLYLVAAYLFIRTPGVSALLLTMILGIVFLVGGLFRMVGSVVTRFPGWGWTFTSGAMTFFLGVIVTTAWPVSGLWLIGALLGVDLLLMGATWAGLGVRARQHGGAGKPPGRYAV